MQSFQIILWGGANQTKLRYELVLKQMQLLVPMENLESNIVETNIMFCEHSEKTPHSFTIDIVTSGSSMKGFICIFDLGRLTFPYYIL